MMVMMMTDNRNCDVRMFNEQHWQQDTNNTANYFQKRNMEIKNLQ